MNNTELMRAYARLRDRRQSPAAATQGAPLEEVLALAEHPPRDAAGLTRLDAVLADPATRDEYVMLRALAREGRRARVIAPRWYAIAAAALLAAGLSLLWRGTIDRGAVVRGTPGAFIVVEPGADDSIIAPGRRITWRAVTRSTYVVEVLDASASPVWTFPTPDTSIVVPGTLQLQPGAILSLQVVATTPEGVEERTAARRVIAKP